MPFKSTFVKSAGKLFGVFRERDLDLRGATQKSRMTTIEATGGSKTTADGYTYHTFTAPGPFVVDSGTGILEMVSIGAGGGGAGPNGGGGRPGAGGGISYVSILASAGITPTLNVAVGGSGKAGTPSQGGNVPTSGGIAGTNGGGTGGNAGHVGWSGGGGGGGGWSGIYTPGNVYYSVGGAGGGGSGGAHSTISKGGGDPTNSYIPNSTTGVNGSPAGWPDNAGYGAGGGGISNSSGTAGGGSGNGVGGSNYANPIVTTSNLYAGGNGPSPQPKAAGFLPAHPSWIPVVPSPSGNGGAGGGGSDGIDGIVIFRY